MDKRAELQSTLRIEDVPTVRSRVAQKLREAIMSGTLKPGQRLVERELCEMTGVSRPSIREALRLLEADGLVTTVPHRGPVVVHRVRAAVPRIAARLLVHSRHAGDGSGAGHTGGATSGAAQPDGATAQNLLGLSTQVPARAVYLSDGPDRSYAFGKTSLAFEHTVLKEAGFRLPESRLVVQALKAYGEDRITPKIIAAIRKKFTPTLRQRILLDTKTATGWVYAAIQEIARKEDVNG
jgi:DNA-binding transcriptional ArsR family regulator